MRMGRGKDLSGQNPSTEVGSGTVPGRAEGLEDRGSWQKKNRIENLIIHSHGGKSVCLQYCGIN